MSRLKAGAEMNKELVVADHYGDTSWFDEQFSLTLFNQSLKKAESKSKGVLDKLAYSIANAQDVPEQEEQYVVQMGKEIKEKLDKGEIKLVQNDRGEVYAQVRNANGTFGERLPIKKELVEQGITVMDVQMAMEMQAIKDQLDTIIDSLQNIEDKVVDIQQGQRNDRIGLFYSGMSLYLEARAVRDPFLRKQIVAQALKSINDANSQMIQDIRTSVDYLENKRYLKTKKPTDKIEEHLSIVQQCYDVVFRAAITKAMIYQESGELKAMVASIDEYGKFVEKLIVPYKGKLSELDKSSKFIDGGRWGAIAKTLEGCKNLKMQLVNRDSYLLVEGGLGNGD